MNFESLSNPETWKGILLLQVRAAGA